MKPIVWIPVLVLGPQLLTPQTPSSGTARGTERGEYLVHRVAMCVQCHSPRDDAGELIPQRLLSGAPIPVAPPFPNQEWAVTAPQIAGLPGFTEEDLVTLLTTGSRPNGETPKRPMPPFRMSREDAQAIAAYLKSLP